MENKETSEQICETVGVENTVARNAEFINTKNSTDGKVSEGGPDAESAENSVICLEEDDDDDYKLPDLPEDLRAACRSSKNLTKNNEDDDFSIVFEKIIPPPEVQIVDSNASSNVIKRKEKKKPFLQDLGPISIHRETTISVQNENQYPQSPNILDHSVCIIGEYEPPVYPMTFEIPPCNVVKRQIVIPPCSVVIEKEFSSRKRTSDLTKESAHDSSEKKKRKIECGVCFDGPDEIALAKKDLVSTICGHIFCSDCIKTTIKITKQCPQCRKKLNSKQYHPIYI